MVTKKKLTFFIIFLRSIGCILGELLLRKPLLPGESLLNQLNLIIHLCGTPNEEDLADIQSARAANYIKSKTNYPGLDFAAAFPDTNPLIVDLLRKLLVFNPVIKKKLGNF